jgi:hypothetical protein
MFLMSQSLLGQWSRKRTLVFLALAKESPYQVAFSLL